MLPAALLHFFFPLRLLLRREDRCDLFHLGLDDLAHFGAAFFGLEVFESREFPAFLFEDRLDLRGLLVRQPERFLHFLQPLAGIVAAMLCPRTRAWRTLTAVLSPQRGRGDQERE